MEAPPFGLHQFESGFVDVLNHSDSRFSQQASILLPDLGPVMKSKVQMHFLPWGSCRGPGELIVAGGGWTWMEQPVLVGIIDHPIQGRWLVDCGLHPRLWKCSWYLGLFLHLAQARVPTGPPPVRDVQGVFLSHFHLDHAGGLRDFADVPIITSQRGYQQRGLGWCDSLLPEDFRQRSQWLESMPESPIATGLAGRDVFGDGSVWAVDLSGHAPGMFGLYCHTENGPVFFVADAVAHRLALSGAAQRFPLLLASDWRQERRVRKRLANMPGYKVASHCPVSYLPWQWYTES